MLQCSKCKGRVFLDMVFSEYNHYELFCIRCGKRWMIPKESNYGTWLTKKLVSTT